ncbi:MAG: hypothetical protein EBZ76_10295 [Synechococcaceae bacterium WB9_2_170]|nr:hypothetical protein [Synechococcaceae bacterium WB9_2_170]
MALINSHVEPDLWHPPNVVLGVGLLYCLYAWLFGAYTLLRWPWLKLRLVLQRLLLTAIATLLTMVVCFGIALVVALDFPQILQAALAAGGGPGTPEGGDARMAAQSLCATPQAAHPQRL